MILATIQPSFLPWLGYLEQMSAADIFVYLDDVRYTRQDWRNRNRLLNAAGKPEYLTVPVRADSDRQLIKDTLIAEGPNWSRKMTNKLKAWYARAPHAQQYLPHLNDILGRKHKRLVDLNYDVMELLTDAYGISTPTVRASDAAISATDKNQRLIDLCRHYKADVLYDGAAAANFIDLALFRNAGVTVIFQNYKPQPYMQGPHPFVSHLSSMDALLWCGEGARDVLRSSPLPDALKSART
jgi:WbqC-like protein family